MSKQTTRPRIPGRDFAGQSGRFARRTYPAPRQCSDVCAGYRRVANRSLIKDLTARDLETRKIATVAERIEEALAQASRLAKKLLSAAQRRADRILRSI
jgi:hypothetical protein